MSTKASYQPDGSDLYLRESSSFKSYAFVPHFLGTDEAHSDLPQSRDGSGYQIVFFARQRLPWFRHRGTISSLGLPAFLLGKRATPPRSLQLCLKREESRQLLRKISNIVHLSHEQ